MSATGLFFVLFLVLKGAPVGAAALPQKLPADDRKAYELLMKTYYQQDLKKLEAQEQQFSKNFSDSPLKDNATYLLAQMLMEKKQWKAALTPLNRILKNELTSERWSAALYARGLAFKNLGQRSQAVKQWKVLMKRFPGSRESQKAWVALRLMKSNKKMN